MKSENGVRLNHLDSNGSHNESNNFQAQVTADLCNRVDLTEAANSLARTLLCSKDLDCAVNQALAILGMSVKADRLNLHKHEDDPTQETLGCVVAQYEWLSDYADSQIEHPQLHRISYDGIEDCYHLFCVGEHWGGLIDDLPEPFRSGQLKLGVKTTYAIPIMVEKEYWGIISLDFCRTARLLEEAEIVILKTATTCIGSTIERRRTLQEQEEIKFRVSLEQQKSRILQESDRILKITTNTAQALLNNRSIEQGIAQALQIIGEGINTDRVAVLKHHDDPTEISLGYLEMLYEWYSPDAISQLQHPSLKQISYEGIENWYEQLSQGNTIGSTVDKLAEPVRSGQIEIGVKSTYAIPIIIDDKYWGIVAFDDCREVIQRSETEISILKTTAVCVGSAIERNRIRQQQEQAERNILLERQKSQQLAEHNLVLAEQDRLLEVTASAANVILTESNFDKAIALAIQIIGEGIDTDRVTVIENWHNLSKPLVPHWRLLYEWNSPQTISQISHPETTQGSYEGIEEWYELQSNGQSISFELADIPEPFRSGQEKLGVKTLHGVPIFIEGKHWGLVGFDDCRNRKRRSETELNILKTAAACIGGAIAKERIRCAQAETEKTILLEREKTALATATQLAEHNQILEQRDGEIQRSYSFLEIAASAANIISTEENFDLAIKEALRIIGEGIDTDRIAIVENFDNPADFFSKYWKITYEWDSAYAVSQIDHPEAAQGSYKGIEEWYDTMSNGQSVSSQIAQMLEPFRSKMEKIGVKSMYLIPIMVDGKYWGTLGIDDCRRETYRSETELNILKTAAACIGGAIAKERSREAKEEAEKAILLEREKAALEKGVDLLKANQTLSLRDKWLEATANAANKLLKNASLEEGINAALKVLGESLNCDRVDIMQHFAGSKDKPYEFVRLIHEWNSIYAVSQMSHPELNEVSAEGIEDWFIKLKAGDWIGGVIGELREPFRSGQLELGVKATYSVPIFVNNAYWGAIGIDFCREPRHLATSEIAVFKTVASCIGSAIYRQQVEQDKDLAELAILDERNRMAREIHDTLAQAFTGISLQLEAARNILSIQPEAARERLLQAKKLAKEGISEARRSVRALRPETLEFNDLAIALQQLTNNMTAGINIKAQVIIEGKPQLSSEIEADLYRIAQEAITNILRHAQATELTLNLSWQINLVELQIKDNGVGFEPQQVLNNSFGLIGMQERCDCHNGNLVINSYGDRGTKIIASIPI